MNFNPIYPKKNNSNGNDKEIPEKKIEFSKKLTTEDIGDLPKESHKEDLLKKGGGFDFLKRAEEEEEKEKIVEKVKKDNPLDSKTNKIPEEDDNSGKIKKEEIEEKAKDEILQKSKEKKGFFSFFKRKKEKLGGIGAANILEVNLVKSEVVKFFDWQKAILILIISIFSAFFIISFVYWGISWWGSKAEYKRDPYLVQNYYKLDKEIKSLENEVEEISRFKEKIELVDSLIEEHIYWSNFFTFLEENTLANVFFVKFAGDAKGEYVLAARSNDFNAIDAQVKKFVQNENVKKAEVSSGSVSRGEEDVIVNFSIKLSVKEDIFFQ